MKYFFALFILSLSWSALAADHLLSHGQASYVVKHLVKTVRGESQDVRGKIACEKSGCEFLVAAPITSFVSSDSNRDLNMQTILEATKYPLVTAKGKFPEADLSKKKISFTANISFHGIEKPYLVKIQHQSGMSGEFVLLLEDHKVERPSLLTVAIENEVPIKFSFNLKDSSAR